MADAYKLEDFGGGRGEGGRPDDGARAPRRRASRGRLGVLATLVAAIALASPVAASARDSSKDSPSPASGSTEMVDDSRQSGSGKKGSSGGGGGGSQTKAAWGS
jgi:hypothetical protein